MPEMISMGDGEAPEETTGNWDRLDRAKKAALGVTEYPGPWRIVDETSMGDRRIYSKAQQLKYRLEKRLGQKYDVVCKTVKAKGRIGMWVRYKGPVFEGFQDWGRMTYEEIV